MGQKLHLDTSYICNGKKVQIVQFLGKGKGGYSYLGLWQGKKVVVKQIHYEPCEVYRFPPNKLKCELRDYEKLWRLGLKLPRLIYADDAGQFLVKEYIAGKTVCELVAKKQVFRQHFLQIHQMCGLLYKNGLNIDFSPLILLCKRTGCIMWIMNVTLIWPNGIFKTGAYIFG